MTEGENSSVEPQTHDRRRIRYFPTDFKGPYYVFLRATEGKTINQVTVATLIYKKFKKVVEVRKIFADKIRVAFSDVSEANKCVSDKDLSHYRVYVQSKVVEVDGVVIMELDEDEKVIQKGVGKVESLPNVDIKIIDVYRMKKKVRGDRCISEDSTSGDKVEGDSASQMQVEEVDQAVKWMPAKAVCVTFEGTMLPDFVKIQGLVIKVLGFTPKVMFCDNCLKFGHTKSFCNNKSRCKRCGVVHSVGELCSEPKFTCPNCNMKFNQRSHVCKARAEYVGGRSPT